MDLGDREFTSEEVAELCGVTRVTVADWISRGRLQVRWTLGGHRRIPRSSLAAFMEQQGYAVPRVVASNRALTFVLERDADRAKTIAAAFEPSSQFEVEGFAPGVDALLAIGHRRPDIVVFGTRVPGFDSLQFVDALREQGSMRDSALVAVMPTDDDGVAWRRLGVDIVSSVERIRELRPTVIRWLTDRQRRMAPEEVAAAAKAKGKAAAKPTSRART